VPYGKGHPIVAALYDRFLQAAEKQGRAALRAQVVGDAAGVVLEIGIGIGLNLPHYRPESLVRLYAVEPDPYMRRRAEARAKSLGLTVEFVGGRAEALPFEDESIDTVVITLVLCSVNSMEQATAEVRRVLRPGGALRFLEHVRGTEAWRSKLQDLITPLWRRVAVGCHPNRRT
jgi:ubiquinone/menaquinone biosynthesis C-methylase UbiE